MTDKESSHHSNLPKFGTRYEVLHQSRTVLAVQGEAELLSLLFRHPLLQAPSSYLRQFYLPVSQAQPRLSGLSRREYVLS